MKLKFIIACTIVTNFVLGVAHANDQAQVPSPIRQATGKLLLLQLSTQPGSKGDVVLKENVVCEKDLSIDVYDLRSKDPGQGVPTTDVTCETTVRGQRVKIVTSCAVLIFEDEKGTPYKSFACHDTVDPDQGELADRFDADGRFTTLDLKSTGGQLAFHSSPLRVGATDELDELSFTVQITDDKAN